MNAELIKALRYCSDNEKEDGCDECPYLHNGMCRTMLSDAAYALEAADAQLPKWTMLKDEMPKLHTKVLVSGIEAINNTRVYKVMVNDNGTLRPTDYAPSIMWDCWMPFGSPNCGARMQTVTNCHTLEEGEQHGES